MDSHLPSLALGPQARAYRRGLGATLISVLPALLWAIIALGPGTLSAASSPPNEVIKSPSDGRQYEFLVLENRLKVLLISDPSTDKAAVSMDVGVGNADDPSERAGLAHFAEHMLFMGTEKYPAVDEFGAFVAQRGGKENAFTGTYHTNYHFDIDARHLAGALDRFAQFFIAPRFDTNYVDRERQVVHAEYRSKLKDDSRRTLYALKQITNPRHPFSRFSTGNAFTLRDTPNHNVRDELLTFYQRHYRASNMALVILGREQPSELAGLVKELFAEVKDHTESSARHDEPLFSDGVLPATLSVVPNGERRTITLTFPIPSLTPSFRIKPVHYVASLLNYQGPKQLLTRLIEGGLATSLRVRVDEHSPDETQFNISMALTEQGLENTDRIVAMTLQYLRLIASRGVEKWRYDELAAITETDFRFIRRTEPLAYVRDLSRDLHLYPSRDVVRAPHIMDDYSPEEIRAVLSALVPENMLVTIVAKGLDTDAKAPWYETPYKLEKVTDHQIKHWIELGRDAELELPLVNKFLATDFSLKKRDEEVPGEPVLVKSTDGLHAWYRPDDTFMTPRADILFTVHSAHANVDASAAVLTELYVEVVKSTLSELEYPVRAAGLQYVVYPDSRGFSVRISGFNDKQSVLLERVLTALRSPSVTEQRFAVAKDRLARRFRNARAVKPYKQALREINRVMLKPYWSANQLLSALRNLDATSLEAHIERLYSGITVQALAHGNLRPEDSIAAFDLLESRLLVEAQTISVPKRQIVDLDDNTSYVRQIDVQHRDSAIAVYYQGRVRDDENLMRYALIAQVINKAFYKVLRTEKNLGYIVYARYLPIEETPGIAFVVQSPDSSPRELQEHIDQFLAAFLAVLEGVSDEQFEASKQGLLSRLLKNDEHIAARSARYWRELMRGYDAFDRQERLATSIQNLDRKSLLETYRSQILGKTRSRLVVYANGTERSERPEAPAISDVVIDEPEKFKANRSLFPDRFPSNRPSAGVPSAS